MIYARQLRYGLFIFFLLSFSPVRTQNILLTNAYAHNDYWHKRPLHDALYNGFTYVEVDIYLRRDKLIVAHILPCFKKKRTLESLYLKPLMDYVTANDKNKQHSDPITLMIDIKTDADKTYKALASLIEKYKSILSGIEHGELKLRRVTIVITGHKPCGRLKEMDTRFVFMDEDLKQTGKDSSNNMYPIASCKYSSLLKWKGKGNIPARDKRNLQHYVNRAHGNGRKVRLWASPENKAVWRELLKCNVDLINTDKLIALKKFLIADLLLVAKKE